MSWYSLQYVSLPAALTTNPFPNSAVKEVRKLKEMLISFSSLISMNEPEAEEIKVNPKAERGSKENPLVMSKSSVLSTGAPIEYISDNLVRVVATGKYIKLEGK